MIIDKTHVFSECQTAFSTDLFTQVASTNIIDLGAEDLAIGAGTPLYLNIRLAESFITTLVTTGTITFKLDHDTGSTFVDTGPALFQKIVNVSDMVTIGGGNQWILRQAIPGKTKRYLRLLYVRGLDASTAFTGGMHINAWLGPPLPETDVGT